MLKTKELVPYKGEPNIERLITAFRVGKVDRVPNFETLIEEKHVEKILGKHAGGTLGNRSDLKKDAGRSQPMNPYDYIDLCNLIGQDAIMFDGGLWTPFKIYDKNGNFTFAYNKTIKNKKDFNSLVLDSDNNINTTVGYIEKYKKALKKRNSKIGISVIFGCLLQTLYEFVVGMNDFMMLVYEDIQFVDDMLEVSMEHFIKLSKAVIKSGVDFIFVADDVAFKTGLFLPPKIMREIWVPRMVRIFEPALNAGIPIMFHSDGKIDDIVEDLIEIGLNCLNPMDPYGIDYREYKKRYGSRLCLSGNVDIEFPLSKGTPEDVDADVKEHMEVLKPGYGYVATCSHSIVNYIPHENVIAYFNAIHKYGQY